MPDIPVRQGGTYEVDIHGMGHGGEGVGRFEGFTLFVPGALIGERVQARVKRVQKQFGEAELVQILQSVNERIQPRCNVYEECGGCQLQHMDYAAQLRQKRQTVIDALERIGGFKGIHVHDPIGMDEPWRYRNKIVLPVTAAVSVSSEAAKRLSTAGYYRRGTHEVVSIDDCAIAHEQLERAALTLLDVLNDLEIPPYNATTGKGVARAVMARNGFGTGELMLVLITGTRDLPQKERLIAEVKRRLPDLTSFVHNINSRDAGDALGCETSLLYGRDHIYEQLGTLRFSISAQSFFQVNPIQTLQLYGKAVEYAELTGTETVVDAHCGTGAIALFMAHQAQRVYGFEPIRPAIADAKENARLNHVANAVFTTGTAERGLGNLYADGVRPDVIVLDPPRKGCEPELLELLVKHRPKKIVYVSCNPATLARDLKRLAVGGYELGEIQPVDMFPQTVHVECVCSLIYKGFE